MDRELENFIRECRARVAEDKASLEQDPPYMEIRTHVHKTYGSAIKENIPPTEKTAAQGKEESFCMGLGVDYARKKQRLQHDLRMDYRRYMAQKNRLESKEPGPRASVSCTDGRSAKEHRMPHPPSLPDGLRILSNPKWAPPTSSRDAPPLREGRRTTHMPTRMPTRMPTHMPTRMPTRLCRESAAAAAPDADDDDNNDEEDGDDEEEELEKLLGGRRKRHMGVQALESSSPYRADGEWKENPAGGARADRRLRLLINKDKAEFATGLLIGVPDAEEALKKRNERYGQELQEQIAEQRRNRQREKELYLRVAVTGETDPDKRPDRIKYIGLSRRPGEVYTRVHAGEKAPLGGVAERPSPLLEYSAALGEGRLSPYSQTAVGRPRGLDTPRIPALILPHPSLPEVQRCQHGDAEPYYSGGNPQDPHLPYYGQLPQALSLPVGGTVHQLGHHSPQSQYSGSNIPDHPALPMRPRGEAGTVEGPFLGERACTTRDKMLSYKEALEQQILERQERRRLELEKERYEAQLEVRNHHPWASGGGGAPLRDATGNLITDLKLMHKLNEEAYINPEQRNKRAPAPSPPRCLGQPQTDNRVSAFAHAHTPQFGRGSVFTKESTPQQLQDQYKADLKEQILERQERRRLELEKERYEDQREADMRNRHPWASGGGGAPLRDASGNLITDLKLMHKLNEEAYINPEQRNKRAPAPSPPRCLEQPQTDNRVSACAYAHTPQFGRGSVFTKESTPQQLQDQYKADLKEQIEEKQRRKAEEKERCRLEEEKAERKMAEENVILQRRYEAELERTKRKEMAQKTKKEELAKLAEEAEKRAKREAEEKNAEFRLQSERKSRAHLEEVHREPSPPIPTLQRKQGPPRYTPRPPTVGSQRSTAPMSERSLSGIQSPPVPACKNQLRATAEDRRAVFSELSAMRRQLRSEQRRLEGHLLQAEWDAQASPPSNGQRECPPADVFDMARLRMQAPVRRPQSRNVEFKPSDGEYRSRSSQFPRGCEEEEAVVSGRRQDYGDQYHQASSSQRTAKNDYLDLLPPHQRHYQRCTTGDSARGSLLESESAFIDPLGEAYPVPPTTQLRETPQLSARERRRLAKNTQPLQTASRDPVGQPDSHSLWRVQNRTARQLTISRNKIGPAGLSSSSDEVDYREDEEESSPRSAIRNHQTSSWESVATDLWTQPLFTLLSSKQIKPTK